jgi:hypothetical protein
VKQQSKNLYGKMVDFKRFGIVLLAIGAFFYLGVILPNVTRSTMDLNIMIFSSTSFLAASIFFFIQSKKCQIKLTQLENEENEINRK